MRHRCIQNCSGYYSSTGRRKKLSHFKSIVDCSSDAIISKDLNGVITSWNKAAERIFGYSAHDMIGESMLKIYPEHRIHEETEFLKQIIAGKQIINFDTQRLRHDGELINVSLTISPMIYRNEIIGASSIARDTTKIVLAQNKIWRQAHFDALTQIPNRKYFLEQLEKVIASSLKENEHFAIMFIDLDNFKLINDTYGHTVGDDVIKHVANVINSIIRENDMIARLGGDEFVILLPIVKIESEIYRLGDRIISELMSHNLLDNHQIIITASIGVSIYPEHGQTKEELMRRADHAMYQSKALGKNQLSIFSDKQTTGRSNYSLICDLQQIDCEDEIQIFYQPIIDVESERIIKAEALVRWQHPKHGLLCPETFIYLAEEYGIIHKIDECVAKKALLQLSKWLSIFGEDFQITLNKSPLEFKSLRNNLQELYELIRLFGLSAKNVIIEITEENFMSFTKLHKNKLDDYQKFGFAIALDDFGTSYSAFSNLKEFNVGYIKLNKALVHGIHLDSAEYILIEGVTKIAKKLDIKVVAEGIETEQQYKLLKQIGVDLMQGTYVSPPLDAESFEKLMPAS
ncbi:sensor domain-containing protein [Methylophaga sp. UBA3613]|uniref:sensor domain-containing protein n=1 Tax=Methylophaga sp. UBA3613 TaxID=1946888 RepID=UPI0025CDD29A|nr:EAL domain-containing protein [Methylophaga sp. UBA3613]